MKKGLRIFIVVVIVLIALLFTLPYLFKGKIMEAVKTEINKSVEAQVAFEDVNLSLLKSFPSLYLGIEDLSVTGKDAFAEDTLVSFKSFDATINLPSVFRGNSIEVNAITLNQPTVYAHILPNGKANWDIAPADTTEEKTPDTTSGDTPDIRMALQTFKIKNGRIAYLDEAGNMMAGLKGVNYQLSGDFSAKTSTMKQLLTIESLTFIYDEIRYINKAGVSFDAAIDADLEQYKFTFKENTLSLNELKLNFDGWLGMPEDAINMDIAFNTPSTDFKSLLSLIPENYMKDFEDLETTGNFNLDGRVEGSYEDGKLPAFSANLSVSDGTISYPDLPRAVTAINIKANVENPGGSGMENKVNVSSFHAEMAENPMDASLQVHTTEEDVEMKGALTGKLDFSRLSELISLEGMELSGMMDADMEFAGRLSDLEKERYEKFKANGKLQLNGFTYKGPELPEAFKIKETSMQFSPGELALLSFDANTGNSDISLNGSLSNYIPYVFRDETIKGELNVRSNKLIASDFLVETEAPEDEEVPEDTTALTAFKVPENIDFVMNARISSLRYDKMKINDFNGKIRVKNGIATLKNTQMNMLGGQIQVNGYYDSRNTAKPKIDFGLDVNSFSIPETYSTFNTFKKLAPIAQYMEGRLSTSLSISGQLDQYLNPLLASFNGKGTLESQSVQIEEAPLFSAMAEKTKAKQLRNPTLKNVYASFKIADGTVYMESKTMKLAGHEFTVAGSQGLDKTMDYTISTTLPRKALGGAANDLMNNLASQAGLDISGHKNIGININISGKTNDPAIGLSFDKKGESARDELRDKMEDELEKQKQKAKEKAREELEKRKKKGKQKAKETLDEVKDKAKEKGKQKLDSAKVDSLKKGKQKLKKKAKEKLKELW